MATVHIRNGLGKVIHSILWTNHASYSRAIYEDCFVNVDLTDADLPGSNLEGCVLIGAKPGWRRPATGQPTHADLRYQI